MTYCSYKKTRQTYDLGVAAADWTGTARITATNADDADRRAVEANQAGDVTQDDPQKTEEEVRAGGSGLLIYALLD